MNIPVLYSIHTGTALTGLIIHLGQFRIVYTRSHILPTIEYGPSCTFLRSLLYRPFIHIDISKTPTGDTGPAFVVLSFKLVKALGYQTTFRFLPVS